MATEATRLDSAELDRYWQQVSKDHAGASSNGFELICYAGMPTWFNRFIHHYQLKTFERLLVSETLLGKRVLDIGTGVGRWARWYAQRGAFVTGIDLEPARLAQAQRAGGDITYRQMGADRLAFPDASFDIVNCVTVLQHTPDDVKRAAIAEVARVSTPEARVVLLELTDMSDDASHVFPWPAQTWERAFAAHRYQPERRAATEFIPLLRVLKRLHRRTTGHTSRTHIDAIKRGRRSMSDRAQLAALRAAVAASYPLEEAAMRIAPRSSARIGAWLFKRTATVASATKEVAA